ncbi:MAG: hypothetical protein ABWZ74_10405 [Hyphomicrobiaceae bacterium]|jgi:hypothetical protein
MRRITTLTGAGKLRTVDRDLGDVDYEIVVWREPRGWKLADGSLVADGPAIVSAFHSNAQVLLDLETGEHLMIEVTQASMAKGQFVVSGPMPRSRQPAKIKATSMTAAKVKAVRQVAGQGNSGPVERL